MRVKVRVVGRDHEVIELSGNEVKVSDLLRKLGLLSEEYIVMRGGKVLTEEDEVVDGDEVVLVPVVSGG